MEIFYTIVFGFLLCLALFLIKGKPGPYVDSGRRKSAYEEKLLDERWRRKRMRILERDNYTCQWCGKQYNLQVHHKSYEKYPDGKMAEPWDYPDRLLITLCGDCHRKYHEKYKVRTFYRKRGLHYF